MKRGKAIICALPAAAFYAVNMPFFKILLEYFPSAMRAGLLYLGAGLGVGLFVPPSCGTPRSGEIADQK